MNPSHRRRTLGIAAVAAAGALAASASAASWSKPVYPPTSGAAQARNYTAALGLAQATNGQAMLLYQTRGNAIYATKRASASGKWSAPAKWLSGSTAKMDAYPVVFSALWRKGNAWAMWSRSQGHRIASSSGTYKAGVGGKVVQSADIDPMNSGGSSPSWSVTASCCSNNATFGIGVGGTAYAGTVAWGKAPSLVAPTAQVTAPMVAAGVPLITTPATSSTGEVAALLAPIGTSSMLEAGSVPPSPWAAGASIDLQNGPSDIAIDSQGNGIIAYTVGLDAAGQPMPQGDAQPAATGIFTSQRVGVLQAPPLLQSFTTADGICTNLALPGLPWHPSVAGLSVGVNGGTVAVGFTCVGANQTNLYVSNGAVGGVLPTPTVLTDAPANVNSSSPTLSVLDVQVNASGQAATILGYGLTQGQTDSLWATVSPNVGAPWTFLTAIDGCNGGKRQGAGGGFGRAQLVPFNTGFTATWECVSADGGTTPNNVGIATYR